MSERRFTDRDDRFHFSEMGEDWWATETAWFSFHHPGRRLGGWLHTMVRPNIGTVAGGAWVWDDLRTRRLLRDRALVAKHSA
jgi:hypothetical protein